MTSHRGGARSEKVALIVARGIVQDIDRRGLTVGDRLPAERAMLEAYGVGRGTLREALRFLELQNVLSLKPGPGGGPTIEKPDSSALANAMLLLLQFENAPFATVAETRGGIEPLLARLAASRMSDESLSALAESVDRMAVHLDDRAVFLETNKEFHNGVAWATENALFGFLINAMLDIFDGTVVGVDYNERRRQAVLKAHRRILDALLLRDSDASEAAMAEHIEEYARYMARKYPEALARPITWDIGWRNGQLLG
ncbi:FadR/GntR family transcriptional regulator [Gordonia hydrophobica]|uniref:FCD domain-containing protein n=1 Tax=Gordonia hydrophobica TaxID=40516 RepID=A0ABZ2TW69_9ACTN|nr:FCD domain-containing protein [Gordonia hydrophobica]MBM7365852.1 DNA-binding FadR family transcriptional regulator [Gordonia hydrophobica]